MINDNILIKIFRGLGYPEAWPSKVRNFKTRLKECLEGFPGIGLNDLTLVKESDILFDYPIIIDRWLWSDKRETDEAPLMIKRVLLDNETSKWRIEGIGCQRDMSRDPNREIKWKNIYPFTWFQGMGIFDTYYWLIVTGKDRKKSGQAGSAYHYFSRCLRDQRP